MRGSFQLPAIVLAAGRSSRMGEQNKLLMEVERVPMVRRVVEAIHGAGIGKIYVVTGFEKELVENCLKDCDVEFVFNGNYKRGMGSSLAAGIQAAESERGLGFLVCLGDLPYVKSDTVARIVKTFEEYRGEKVVIPTYRTQRGHPIAFPNRFAQQLKSLNEDLGAKRILEKEEDCLIEIEVTDFGIVRDIDTASHRT